MEEQKVILNTSDEAATYRTGISGWVSRNGRFYGKDERIARWDGCTHIVCECGETMPKGYTRCAACQEKKEIERYAMAPQKEWDGKAMLYSEYEDRYFNDADEVFDFCHDEGKTPKSLRLYICEPNYAREIDPNDRYCDELPEDCVLKDVPGGSDLLAAFDELNRFIRESKTILSWSPGRFAAVLETFCP